MKKIEPMNNYFPLLNVYKWNMITSTLTLENRTPIIYTQDLIIYNDNQIPTEFRYVGEQPISIIYVDGSVYSEFVKLFESDEMTFLFQTEVDITVDRVRHIWE